MKEGVDWLHVLLRFDREGYVQGFPDRVLIVRKGLGPMRQD